MQQKLKNLRKLAEMKISFIIPAYNAEKTLTKCINSLLNQTNKNWESVIIDDGSLDNTFNIAKSFEYKDERIKVLTQKNSGPGAARNNAFPYCDGEYIAFLDSDDYIEYNYVELVIKLINQNKSDVVIIDNYYEDEYGKVIRIENLSKFNYLTKPELIATQMTGKMPWGGCRKIIKKEIIENNKIRYSKNIVGEEALFSFLVLYYAKKIDFLGKLVYHYVDNPKSQSKKGGDDPWGPVVNGLNKYITENIGNNFRKEINSFAYTALIVYIYRVSVNYSFRKALKLSKKKIKEIKKVYNGGCNKKSFETRVKLLLPFVKINFITPLILISKIKYKTKLY